MMKAIRWRAARKIGRFPLECGIGIIEGVFIGGLTRNRKRCLAATDDFPSLGMFLTLCVS